MATPTDPSYRERLLALADKYAAALPDRLNAVEQGLEGCISGIPTTAELEVLHHALHAIAGSAGSFGFRLLGEQARRLEQDLRAMLEQGAPWGSTESGIRQFLEWARRDPRSATYPPHD